MAAKRGPRHLYLRIVIQGARVNGPWEPIRSDFPPHNHKMGNALAQKAVWTRKQVETSTWSLTKKGRRLNEEARAWRAEGW